MAKLNLPQLEGARLVAAIVAGVVALIALVFIAWFFFVRPGQNAAAAAQGKVNGKLGTAAADISAGAIPQINEAHRQKVDVDIHVQEDQANVRSAPDAGVEIRGVSDAVLRSVCMYNEAATDRACQSLHEDSAGIGFVGRDAAGSSEPD